MSVKRDSPEWFYMWSRLETGTGQSRDHTCECGQAWEYMGTWAEEGQVLHNFRHRCGFSHDSRRYVNVVASDLFVKEEVKAVTR